VKRFAKVGLIGTGAVGGSVGGALRARGLADEVCGFDPTNAPAARDAGLIDRVAGRMVDAVAGADLVVLAAPVPVNRALLGDPALRETLDPRATLTDVSSTKARVVAAAQAGLGDRRSRFVASHPIAGADRGGPAAARIDLFQGAGVLVTPLEDSAPDAVECIHGLWRALGARTAEMDALHHDRLFAEVSHWPHAVAFALSASVGGGPLADDARRWYGAGLRDTTRVGGSPPELWAGILLDNKGPTLEAARAFRAELDRIEQALRDDDREALVAALARGANWRSSI